MYKSSTSLYIMDIKQLLAAVDNEANDTIMNLTNTKIKKIKNDMLQRLQLPREKLREMHKKLKHYRYVDELPDIKPGTYIRWIRLQNPEDIRLSTGGIVCSITIGEGVNVVCKNNINRMFQCKLGDSMVFQKITDQEAILLSALDYIQE
jgi:hypothetical protein